MPERKNEHILAGADIKKLLVDIDTSAIRFAEELGIDVRYMYVITNSKNKQKSAGMRAIITLKFLYMAGIITDDLYDLIYNRVKSCQPQ